MSRSKASAVRNEWAQIRRVEALLGPLCLASRQVLSAACPDNGHSERLRMRDCLLAGDLPQPAWETPTTPRKVVGAFRVIDALRKQVCGVPAESLYLAKLDELELDLSLLSAIGDARQVRPLARRRFPQASDLAPTAKGPRALSAIADELLSEPVAPTERRTLPAVATNDERSLARVLLAVARAAKLDMDVEVEPRLAAGAASGERTVFVADRQFGEREALRLAVHEVLGHITVAANGRAQPVRLLEWGTAGSFCDQEGVAIYLEHAYGLLDGARLRTLAGRVRATDRMHAEANFGETARHLHRDLGFSADEAIGICERAYRGGGLARDASYLLGYLRVKDAIEQRRVTLDELRMGRVSLDALPTIRELIPGGLARPAVYTPSLSRSFLATISGTTFETSPPRSAASLTRLELT